MKQFKDVCVNDTIVRAKCQMTEQLKVTDMNSHSGVIIITMNHTIIKVNPNDIIHKEHDLTYSPYLY